MIARIRLRYLRGGCEAPKGRQQNAQKRLSDEAGHTTLHETTAICFHFSYPIRLSIVSKSSGSLAGSMPASLGRQHLSNPGHQAAVIEILPVTLRLGDRLIDDALQRRQWCMLALGENDLFSGFREDPDQHDIAD